MAGGTLKLKDELKFTFDIVAQRSKGPTGGLTCASPSPDRSSRWRKTRAHSALVDVVGVRRRVDVSLVEPDGVGPGDWVLIHVGFAMSKISEQDAYDQMRMLTVLGESRGRHGGGARLQRGRCRCAPEGAILPMKYIDEFREPELISKNLRGDPAAGRPRAALPADGGVRRPHPRDLPLRPQGSAAAQHRTGPRSGLPGLRAADGPHRRRPVHRRRSPT